MPEELEGLLTQLQMHNQQLQTIMIQKQGIMMQSRDIENALEYMEKMQGDEVYKTVGPILVKANKEDVRKELEESKEELDMKTKALQNQEKRIKDKLKESQERFQELARHAGHGG